MAALETVSNDNEKRGPSYFHNPGNALKMITIGQLLDNAAKNWSNEDAIILNEEKQKLTFKQLKEKAEQLEAGLLKLGLKPGDRLALLGGNSLHWCTAFLAAAKSGIITAMSQHPYAASELESVLKHLGARCIIMDHKGETGDYPAMLAEVIPSMSSAPHGQPLSCPQLPDLSFVIVATEKNLPGCYRLEDISALASKVRTGEAANRVQPEDTACIMYTSGTTGYYKGVVLSHFNLINCIYSVRSRIKKKIEPSTVCLQMSLYQISGLIAGIIGVLAFGNKVIIAGPLFHEDYTIRALQNYKFNFISGTPHIFIALYNEVKKLLPNSTMLQESCENITTVLCTSDHVTSEILKYIKETFPKAMIITGYGLTEVSGAVTMRLHREDLENESGSVGYPSDNVEVKIVDDDGNMVPFGTPGEVWIRSPYNAVEYWRDEETTNKVMIKNNWLRTGDLMVLREDGHLTIIGRKKYMIVRNALKISPTSVENVLLQHPDITCAEVYGVTDTRVGEEVAASIKLKPLSTVTVENLRDYCKGKMEEYKIPRYIRFVDKFPLTLTGKAQKYALKELHEQEIMKINVQ